MNLNPEQHHQEAPKPNSALASKLLSGLLVPAMLLTSGTGCSEAPEKPKTPKAGHPPVNSKAAQIDILMQQFPDSLPGNVRVEKFLAQDPKLLLINFRTVHYSDAMPGGDQSMQRLAEQHDKEVLTAMSGFSLKQYCPKVIMEDRQPQDFNGWLAARSDFLRYNQQSEAMGRNFLMQQYSTEGPFGMYVSAGTIEPLASLTPELAMRRALIIERIKADAAAGPTLTPESQNQFDQFNADKEAEVRKVALSHRDNPNTLSIGLEIGIAHSFRGLTNDNVSVIEIVTPTAISYTEWLKTMPQYKSMTDKIEL